jgi:hypothetical protein
VVYVGCELNFFYIPYTKLVFLRKETGAIEKPPLDWIPHGYKRIGRPKRTWRRTIEDEIKNTGTSWNKVKGIAGDGKDWKPFMDALSSTRQKELNGDDG